MNAQDLTNILLEAMDKHGKNVEIRIGDQIEAGPYSHDRVGLVCSHERSNGTPVIIICAEDADWEDIGIRKEPTPVWPKTTESAEEVKSRE